MLKKKENTSHEIELKSICEKISKSKNTCLLYEFQNELDKFIDEKRVLNRNLIIDCLNQLNNVIPSK